MAQHTYDVKIDGQTYTVASANELSDAQAYQAALGEHQRPQAVAADEPDTYIGGALKGFKEGAVGGAKGFVKGVVPGLFEGAKEVIKSPITLAKGALAAGVGGYHLATDPANTLKDAVDAVAAIPGKASDAAYAAAHKATVDPEGFGNDVGHLTGNAEAAVLAGHLVPLAPKPIARKVGAVVEQVGTKGAWPIRMMGAHQLGSGNPMGIVTMAAPEMLQKTGESLQTFGADPAALKAEADAMLQRGNPAVKSSIRINAPSKDLYAVAQENAAEGAAAKGGTKAVTATPTLSSADIAGLRKQGYSDETIARLAKASESTPVTKFLQSDPQARNGGEGRMTGQFTEGAGGLSDLRAGRITPNGKAAADVAEGRVPTASRAPQPSDIRMDELAGKLGGQAPDAVRTPRVATQDAIPASKSKGAMSATPGLTRADLEAVGGNPDMNYKDMAPEMAARIKALRSSRHGTNYANAVTDKSLRSILEESLLMRNMDRLR